MKICIIISNFYPTISNNLLYGATKSLKKIKNTKYKIFKVAGTFEIPVIMSSLIKKYDGFVVLGCVIKGKTPHFDFLCKSVFDTLLKISITYKKPLGNGILTCLNTKQALDRSNPKKTNKGGAAVEAMISVLNIIKNAK
jgi:6,7-dimethyl-8-ribityllumazine synthase